MTDEDRMAVNRIALQLFFKGALPSTCQRDVDARLGDLVATLESAGAKIVTRGTARFVAPGDPGYLDFGDPRGPQITLDGWDIDMGHVEEPVPHGARRFDPTGGG